MLSLMIIALAMASTTVIADVPKPQQQPHTFGIQVNEETAKALLAEKTNEGRVVAIDISPNGVVIPVTTLRSVDAEDAEGASPNQRCWFFFPPPPPPPAEYNPPNQPANFYSSYYPNWYSNYYRYPYYSYYGRRPYRRPTVRPNNNNNNNENQNNPDEELPIFNAEGQQQFPNFNQGGTPNYPNAQGSYYPGNFANGQGTNYPGNFPNLDNQEGGGPNFSGNQGPNFQSGRYVENGVQDNNARY